MSYFNKVQQVDVDTNTPEEEKNEILEYMPPESYIKNSEAMQLLTAEAKAPLYTMFKPDQQFKSK